jgi:hypothetical protein
MSGKATPAKLAGAPKVVLSRCFNALYAIGGAIWSAGRFVLLLVVLLPIIVFLSIMVALTDDRLRD